MQWRAIVLASITPSYFLNSAILGFEPRGFGTYGFWRFGFLSSVSFTQ